MRTYSDQIASGGTSMSQIVDTALAAAHPAPHLRWLDIGCGRGALLRRIRDEWEPAELLGIDPIDWLDDDLRADVTFDTIPAEQAVDIAPVDRVLLIEVIEHLEGPWSALRQAARLVAPGGRIVVSTPNLARLRNRLELAVRGQFTSFRPDNQPHISPALPHVIARILARRGPRARAAALRRRRRDLADQRARVAGERQAALPDAALGVGDHRRRAPARLAPRPQRLQLREEPAAHLLVGVLAQVALVACAAELVAQRL